MTENGIAEAELAEIVENLEVATNAFLQGDMDRYLALTGHAAGFTLMNPFGGPPKRYEDRRESLLAAADFFQGGTAAIELVHAHVIGDALVLVMIEHQRGRVGGLPEQEWSLRVTQVYRRGDGGWLLVHRHADPLVRAIGLDGAAAIARG